MYKKPHDPTKKNLEGTLKSWYTYQLVYLCDLCAVKFSILTFYRVISSDRSYRIVVYAAMGVVAAFTIAMVLVNAFECPNPSDAWSTEILAQGSGSCHNLHPIYYGQAAFNIFSDIFILLLPMPILRKLHMKSNKRIALIGIFSVGSMAVVASIVRIYALSVWSTRGSDVPYVGANILVWSQIEINVAIISASIPALKPLFKRTFGGSTARGSNRYYYNYGRTFNRREHGQSFTYGTDTFTTQSNIMELKGISSPKHAHHRTNDSDEQVFLESSRYENGRVVTSDESKRLSFETSENNHAAPARGVQVTKSIQIETTVDPDVRYPTTLDNRIHVRRGK